MKLAWATDIHLDHASEAARRKFCRSVHEQADALVVTGDIAESHTLGSALTAIATLTERPVYFVLGNHDLPFFSCKAMGDVLLEMSEAHPNCQILVLCGHTHGGGEVQVTENLRVVTGAAEYGRPEIQEVLQVG